MKIIGISDCGTCPWCVFDDHVIPERWGKHWCGKLNREVTPNAIPRECPLADSPSVNLAPRFSWDTPAWDTPESEKGQPHG